MGELQLTEYQKAAKVAQYVEILDVSLDASEACLLAPREQAYRAREWILFHTKSCSYIFKEEVREIWATVRLSASFRSSEDDAAEIVRCSAVFSVGYQFNAVGGPSPEERDDFFSAFANVNAVFNVWPYFRELVQSSLARMGLQPVALPVYRVNQPRAVLSHPTSNIAQLRVVDEDESAVPKKKHKRTR